MTSNNDDSVPSPQPAAGSQAVNSKMERPNIAIDTSHFDKIYLFASRNIKQVVINGINPIWDTCCDVLQKSVAL